MAGMRRKVRWSWRVGALVIGMLLLGGSAAVASIPQGNTINACRNAQTGALRVIDTSIGAKCAVGEYPLKWKSVNWRNVWLPNTQYFVGDIASYYGSSFIVRLKPPVGTLPTNTTYWNMLASRGLPGLQGIPGLKGATGLVGAVGPTGLQGLVGPTGVQGLQGLVGPTGVQGLLGPTGVQGIPGLPGATGVQGLVGPTGVQGLLGPTGVQGIPGLPGATGVQGIPGLPGATGVQGLVGPTGVQGLLGPTGVQGVAGLPGATGVQGLVGPTGVQGIPGLPGATGVQGLVGPTGVQGIPGLPGATGATGVVDAIFAKINSNGTLAVGKHVSTESSTGGLTPTYTITFDQNVSQCAVSVVPEGVVAIPVLTAHSGSSISVTLTNLTGLLIPSGFDVTVTC